MTVSNSTQKTKVSDVICLGFFVLAITVGFIGNLSSNDSSEISCQQQIQNQVGATIDSELEVSIVESMTRNNCK